MRRSPLSLRAKVGLTLFAVVAGALAIAYVAVVPQLESRLVNAKIDELENALPVAVAAFAEAPAFAYQDRAVTLDAAFDVRVVVFTRISDSLAVRADSGSSSAEDLRLDPVALAAAESLRTATGRVTREEREYAEAAIPLGVGEIVLLSSPLEDTLANVRFVGRSLAVAGAVALLVSWLAGYLVSYTFTRRIRRLEGAAERLAEGDFETPVADPGRDEIAQLAHAFDGMRMRLAALDRARREFIANASHELRTPLFSLGGFVELMAEEGMEPDVRRDFLAEMRAQIERLTRLATDLLDLSRLDAGQLQFEAVPVDLAACARVVADEFGPVADAEEHGLRAEADEPTEVIGDELRLHQIVRALVENAVRHTPPGTSVAVSVGRRDGSAYLEVRDDGPGIPEEDQRQLFQRFYRAAGGKASGSGLGLAIASELATKMGGALELRSVPGETVFTLVLPLDADAPPAVEAEREADPVASGAGDGP